MRGAVFDWDGTLASIDDREFQCINQALADVGAGSISHDFYVNNYYLRAYELGTGPRMVLEAALAGKGEDVAEKAYQSYRETFQASPDRATLQPGARSILISLKRSGFKIGVATMRYTKRVVESELKHLEVSSFIDLLQTRQDLGVQGALPSFEEIVNQRARLVTMALKGLGMTTNEVFLTGDSWWDIRAGKQLGIKTVLVKTGFAFFNDFSKENPDIIVSSLLELQELFEKNDWSL